MAKRADVETRIRQLENIRVALERLVAACPGRGPPAACTIMEALKLDYYRGDGDVASPVRKERKHTGEFSRGENRRHALRRLREHGSEESRRLLNRPSGCCLDKFGIRLPVAILPSVSGSSRPPSLTGSFPIVSSFEGTRRTGRSRSAMRLFCVRSIGRGAAQINMKKFRTHRASKHAFRRGFRWSSDVEDF